MSRVLRAVGAVTAALTLGAGCRVTSPEQPKAAASSASPTPATAASPEECLQLLSDEDAEQVAGTELDPAQVTAQPGFPGCRWRGHDGWVTLTVASVPAKEWGRVRVVVWSSLAADPKLAPADARFLRRVVRDVTRSRLTDLDACRAFTIELEAGGFPTHSVIGTSRDTRSGQQRVTGAGCRDGTYSMVELHDRELGRDTETRVGTAVTALILRPPVRTA